MQEEIIWNSKVNSLFKIFFIGNSPKINHFLFKSKDSKEKALPNSRNNAYAIWQIKKYVI